MNEYQKQALDFLAKANAKMQITYDSFQRNPLWNETFNREKYLVIIATPQGKTSFFFWNSVYNHTNRIKPNEYDILACLEKYDVGTFNDFISEFGYNIDDYRDEQRVKRIYNAVCKEYENLCRIFTPNQMKMLREIY